MTTAICASVAGTGGGSMASTPEASPPRDDDGPRRMYDAHLKKFDIVHPFKPFYECSERFRSGIADAYHFAHAEGRQAERRATRFPGTEPPDDDRNVLARFGDEWEVVYYSHPLTGWQTDGPVGFRVPDFWQELPELSDGTKG